MSSRPSLALSRKSPLKSKKASGMSSGGRKPPAAAPKQPWVDTVNDLDIYKPTKEALESKKSQRKSKNLALAKVCMTDKRVQEDPVRHRLVQQQILLSQQLQPSQNVEAILARSEQVMGICQGILSGEMISPPVSEANLEEENVEPQSPPSPEETSTEGASVETSPPAGAAAARHQPIHWTNSAALSEIAGELLVTVRELRDELIQEREARERLEKEVIQQRELLLELVREVLRLQLHCATDGIQQTRIV